MTGDRWRSLPAFWRAQWRMLGPQPALFWAPLAGAAAFAFLSSALLAGGEHTLFRTVETLAPLLAAAITAIGLRLESAPGGPVYLTRTPVREVVRLKLLTALAVALAAFAPALLLAFVYNPSLPLVELVFSGTISTFYLAAVTAAVTLLTGSALLGGGAAVTLLLFDLLLGYSANPLLSLQGGLAHFDRQPLYHWWLTGKIALATVGGMAVKYAVRRHGSAPPGHAPEALRGGALLTALIAAGALSGVGANLLQRDPSDREKSNVRLQRWLPAPARARMAKAPRYVHGEALQEQHLLRVLERWPGASGADEAAYALLQMRLQRSPHDSAAVHAFADRYPANPRAADALAQLLPPRGYLGQPAFLAAEKLLDRHAGTATAQGVAGKLLPSYPRLVSSELMRKAAVVAARTGDPAESAYWLTVAAELSLALRQREEAREHLQGARAALDRSGGGGPRTSRRIAELRQSVAELSRLLEEGS